MYKTIAFILATLLVANTFAAPDANCLLKSNSDAVCLLCKYNMVVKSADSTCEAPTSATLTCLHPGLVSAGLGGIKVCELCPKGSKPILDGSCKDSTLAAPDASCGLPVSKTDGTAWQCLGCAESSSVWTGFSTDLTKCVTDFAAGGTAKTDSIAILGIKTCPPNIKIDGSVNSTKCTDYGTNATNMTYAGAKNAQAFDANVDTVANGTADDKYYYSSNQTVKFSGIAWAGAAIAGCWIADTTTDTNCLKCRWGFIPTIEALTTANSATTFGKVTCAAYTAPLLAARACVLGYKSGANSLCQTCVDKDGNLSAPSSTNNCTDIVASNNSSNNTSNPTTTTSSSILSLSFAAFLILIINRLF